MTEADDQALNTASTTGEPTVDPHTEVPDPLANETDAGENQRLSTLESSIESILTLLQGLQRTAATPAPVVPAPAVNQNPGLTGTQPTSSPTATTTAPVADPVEPDPDDPATVPPVVTAQGTSIVYDLEEDGKAILRQVKADGSELVQDYESQAEAYGEHQLIGRLVKLLHL